MELSYVEMGKETGDARVNDIIMVLRRLKVLAYSWGKIHSDEVWIEGEGDQGRAKGGE